MAHIIGFNDGSLNYFKDPKGLARGTNLEADISCFT